MWVAGEQVALRKPEPTVHNAAECVRSFGTPIKLLRQGQRATFFCPQCQKP